MTTQGDHYLFSISNQGKNNKIEKKSWWGSRILQLYYCKEKRVRFTFPSLCSLAPVNDDGYGEGEDEDAAEGAEAADQLAREGGRGELAIAGSEERAYK